MQGRSHSVVWHEQGTQAHPSAVSHVSSVTLQAQDAIASEAEAASDPSEQDHLWSFIKDGLNMLIRSATLQVC